MSEIVYVLGAGVNQVIKDRNGLSPPLIHNFFQNALKKYKDQFESPTFGYRLVYEYINKYWKKSISDLENDPFDLEECFTLLDTQIDDAIKSNNNRKEQQLINIQLYLKAFFVKYLSNFYAFGMEEIEPPNPIMERFGEILNEQKPIIITFNYDTLIEETIEHSTDSHRCAPPNILTISSKDQKKLPDEILSYRPSKWHRALGYTIKFDKIQLQTLGETKFCKGKRFYSLPENELHSWYILKLHGSINWFRYLNLPSGESEVQLKDSFIKKKMNEIILAKGKWILDLPPSLDNLVIDPIMITPILNKEKYFSKDILRGIFPALWDKAKKALLNCKKLNVIGYSFPPIDFLTKKMFLEAFSENSLEELIVVNPDTSVVKKVKELCHFDKPVIVCKDLEEYLSYYYKNG